MFKAGTFIIAAALAAIAFAAPADARVRTSQGVVHTAHSNYYGQSTTWRTPGQRTREADVIGPRGGHSSVYDNRTWGDGYRTHDRTRTFANGDTRVVDADATRSAPGVWDYSRDVTHRNGETTTTTGTVTVNRTP